MAKRPRRKERPPTPEDKRQLRRLLIAGSCAAGIVLFMIGLANNFFRSGPPISDDHPHDPPAHGGIIVALEGDKNEHYHVETILEKGDGLKLYTLGDEVTRVVEVESQTLTARIVTAGEPEAVSILLMPVPRPCDAPGKTSQFFGKLPNSVRGKRLEVSIPSLVIAGKSFPVSFVITRHNQGHQPLAPTEDEEKLYLTPGGKYTEEDIHANERLTASQKYKAFKADHSVKPQKGDRLCPVSHLKGDRQWTWIVGGKCYQFCCPPCIDEFVRRAKVDPRAIREPEDYLKK